MKPIVGELSPEEQAFLGPVDPEAMRAELDRRETTHIRRLLIGERLAVLGDPRPGIGIEATDTPEIDRCRVPGGDVTIWILSDPKNPYSEVQNTRRKTIETFYIAHYPITVTQYRAFLKAQDGWRDPAWWKDDLFHDPEGDTYEFGRFGNHPAVYVSWFDAVAFCRWLSRRLRLTICLPDEWEWQQAATGGNGRNAFPWGAEWDPKREPHRANTFESRLGGVTAAGMYPAGTSKIGAMDMAGTVWEWCLNKFDLPEVMRSQDDDLDFRALRGGSWFNPQVIARSAYRDGFDTGGRRVDFGFRVVCSSPSSVTNH